MLDWVLSNIAWVLFSTLFLVLIWTPLKAFFTFIKIIKNNRSGFGSPGVHLADIFVLIWIKERSYDAELISPNAPLFWGNESSKKLKFGLHGKKLLDLKLVVIYEQDGVKMLRAQKNWRSRCVYFITTLWLKTFSNDDSEFYN